MQIILVVITFAIKVYGQMPNCHPSSHIYWQSTVTIERDSIINTRHLYVQNSTDLFIKSGVTLTIVADTISFSGPLSLKCQGANGANGIAGSNNPHPEWKAHHDEWDKAVNNAKNNGCIPADASICGTNGMNGTDAGNLILVVGVYSPISASNIPEFNFQHGKGGIGGTGGAGRRLTCTDHPSHVWDCPRCGKRPDGIDGRDGTVKIYITGSYSTPFINLIKNIAQPAPMFINSLPLSSWYVLANELCHIH